MVITSVITCIVNFIIIVIIIIIIGATNIMIINIIHLLKVCTINSH